MISEIIEKHFYRSPSGTPFRVKEIASHGQDCSLSMIVYTNVEATKDYPADKTWVISESLFMKQFSEYSEGKYHDYNRATDAFEAKRLQRRKDFLLAFSDDDDGSAV